MRYNPKGETFRQIAAQYTIGGAEYGDILSSINLGDGADSRPTTPIDIPDAWLTTSGSVILMSPAAKAGSVLILIILARMLLK